VIQKLIPSANPKTIKNLTKKQKEAIKKDKKTNYHSFL
jgi:hypothetical protein